MEIQADNFEEEVNHLVFYCPEVTTLGHLGADPSTRFFYVVTSHLAVYLHSRLPASKVQASLLALFKPALYHWSSDPAPTLSIPLCFLDLRWVTPKDNLRRQITKIHSHVYLGQQTLAA